MAKAKAKQTDMLPVEKELADACKLKRKKNEKDEAWKKRLVEAADELADDTFEGLSEDAQAWINAGVKAVEEEEDIPAFDADLSESSSDDEEEDEDEDEEGEESEAEDEEEEDDEEDEEEESEEEDEEEESEDEDEEEEEPEEKPKKGKGKAKEQPQGKAKGKQQPKKDDEKPKKKAPPKRGEGATSKIVKYVCENPDIERNDLRARLEKDGHEVKDSTLQIQHTQTKRVIKTLKELGYDIKGKGGGKAAPKSKGKAKK